ncbi:D-alanyl-D-alanine carboxypeptidase family protein [Saccharopolyspora cebuensis]|uniref:D-alanyl-D-alanine carboxypeptidase family protein n=1 Tax=Saccharopolyspora cebuensis TaxID=418759 RepID=A0ABV4CFA1_9PSEU
MPVSSRLPVGRTFSASARRASVVVLAVALLAGGGPALAQQPPARCSSGAVPPPPVDSSEVPPPGVPSPGPLPVPSEPIGGDRLGGCGGVRADGAPEPPSGITAASWVIADLDTGAVLAADDAHARHRPASTIKVLTALVALREFELTDTAVATQADADREGSRVGLRPGVTYSVRDLLHGLLMQSGNDAAHALAGMAGGVHAMVDRMNELAARLGAHDTRAATPSGLDGPGMSTSAYDLALIFRTAMQHPEFAAAVGARHAVLPGPPGQPPLEVWSDNAVLLNYPGALGGKTGYTDDAQHTFIGAAERDGRRLVAVALRGDNKPKRLSGQVMDLLDYGFRLDEPVGELVTAEPRTTTPPAPTPRGAGPLADTTPTGQDTAGIGVLAAAGAVLAAAALGLASALTVRRRRARGAVNRRRRGDDYL